MKLYRPTFIENIHWRKLTSQERNGRPWKYVLLKNFKVTFLAPLCRGVYYLFDGDGTCWGTITPQGITVHAGYAWNGSTASPDWKVILASLVHDLLYQFSGVAAFPLTRCQCDNIFFSLAESPLRILYRVGLLVGGWWCWGNSPPGSHICTD